MKFTKTISANATCGIGHLIIETDREYGWPVGTEISEARVTQLYNQDVGIRAERCALDTSRFR